MNEILEIEDVKIENMIYEVRGKQVMQYQQLKN